MVESPDGSASQLFVASTGAGSDDTIVCVSSSTEPYTFWKKSTFIGRFEP